MPKSAVAKSSAPSHAEDQSVDQAAAALPWWKGAVIYQIYPRSFQDTTGDGIGDLQGIVKRLPYVASLGVDAVWLSPFFTSPMDDFGYDVADYCDVDPMFGTLADFDAVIAKAHELGLKVIIDQVYSHTSDQHPWFSESRANTSNPKADWYVWADPKPDGSPPNNWQSVFGGVSWQWESRRQQYYLHNFLTSQPDLNVHHPDVQDALLDAARFWLNRGVDGFRLDAINFAMHDPELKDNPKAETFLRPPTRPFDYQLHINSMSHPDIPGFLQRIRQVMDDYKDRFTVAEVGGPFSLGEMKAFTAGEDHLHSAYSFNYLYAADISPSLVMDTTSDWFSDPGEGWPSWAFSNHDAPRSVSRWGQNDRHSDYARTHGLLLLSLRGNAFVYQGEELGMVQADIPFDRLQDPEAIANWPETLGRDGARTPMPWEAHSPQAGFSTGEPWLPIDARHYGQTVDTQDKDHSSTLNFFRRAIALRHGLPALRAGDLEFMWSTDQAFAFRREFENQAVYLIFNLGEDEVSLNGAGLPAGSVIFSTDEALMGKPLSPSIAGVTGIVYAADDK